MINIRHDSRSSAQIYTKYLTNSEDPRHRRETKAKIEEGIDILRMKDQYNGTNKEEK
jgi:hypothetical protein